jgi:EAL domain-containing protein (putative c-di-GMP-specific phosphodiesterase class I)
MAIIDQKPRSATIVALENCELIRLTAAQLRHRMDMADPVLRAILDVVLARFREMLNNVTEPIPASTPLALATAGPAAGSTVGATPHDHFSENSGGVEAIAQLRLEHELELAIEDDQFELHFQPIVQLNTGEIAGFEALVRWRHRDRGLVPPLAFIPAAEACGLIIPLSEWCMRQACASLQAFRATLPRDRKLFVAINISGVVLQQPGFFGTLRDILTAEGVDPQDIKLEVTENVLLKDADQVIETLSACRGLGCSIALDDFGTGFSSMSYLSKFPIDTLKIDRSFVKVLHTDHTSRNIVNAIVALGWGLDTPTVAEGIETAEDAEALLALGCTYGQGYYFSRAVSERDAIMLLRQTTAQRQRASRIG